MSMNLMKGDCLEMMKLIPDGSVDMVLCDLPYGTTACAWDAVIPFGQLWDAYWRVCKPNAAVVLTSAQPFTTLLISSQINKFRYEWVWVKNSPSNFANAKHRPMTAHENICVFGDGKLTYNKQPTLSKIKDRKFGNKQKSGGNQRKGETFGGLSLGEGVDRIVSENVSPRTTLEIDCVPRATGTLHPTQKPVALMEYLIRTYTNEGDTVLDNTMGSGTTGVAAANTGRKFIGIERDDKYFAIARKRIEDAMYADLV